MFTQQAPQIMSNGYNGVNNIVTPSYIQPNTIPRPQPQPQKNRTIYYQMNTKNKSFLEMSQYLQAIGIKNNKFMLILIDPDLANIDPFDPHLNAYFKQKVLREVMCNYFYFLREIVRIPDAGGTAVRFKLDRSNMAESFLLMLNINIFLEAPRQVGKTVGSAARYLYIYNFATTNSKMGFFHKNMEGSTDNLQILKDLRDMLPEYLQMKEAVGIDGKVLKGSNTVKSMKNPHNNNMIKAFPSATNKARAASLARGKSLTAMWYDEYGFLAFNDVIYMNAMPAFRAASLAAKRNGAPYGILITTTPGFMTTPEGKEAYAMKEAATKFSEQWYDWSYAKIMELINANVNSTFVYVKFSYQQLGYSEAWFKEVCRNLKNSWPDIRREILLEWATGVQNSPFNEEDLDAISKLVRQPISQTWIYNKYLFETYLQADTITYPPIMGVDVSSGLKHDSSCITIIDSRTTMVLGCMNCNYISTIDLARVIGFITKNWMPNVVINVERNGGYGATVISKLLKMGIRKNLYYEIKDVIAEEKNDGIHAYKTKKRVKYFGLNSTKSVRQLLIDILLDRVELHKDKVVSPIIYNELLGMEIKRNGKVEHSDATHDDQVFSWLMALYVWYEGTNLTERYGIRKTSIKTDEDIDEELDLYDTNSVEIVSSLEMTNDPIQTEAQLDLEAAVKAGGILMKDWIDKENAKDKQCMDNLMQTPLGQKAYRDTYNVPSHIDVNMGMNGARYTFTEDVYAGFYEDDDNQIYSAYSELSGVTLPHSQNIAELEATGYNYRDHFNF